MTFQMNKTRFFGLQRGHSKHAMSFWEKAKTQDAFHIQICLVEMILIGIYSSFTISTKATYRETIHF